MAGISRSPPGAPFLPGTVNSLFDAPGLSPSDIGNDATAPGGTPRRINSKDGGSAEPPMPSLPEQVDDFGWTLVSAIRDFRSHVEDIFAEHYQTMKRAEDMHRMSIAKLVSENGQLRDRLSLNPGSEMFQNLAFQPAQSGGGRSSVKVAGTDDENEVFHMGDMAKKKKAAKQKDGSGPKLQFTKQDSEYDASRMRTRNVVDPQPGGGNWETFVAWVPAGAALQAPQPWKPLPNEAFIPVDMEPKLLIEEHDEEGKLWEVLESWEAELEELESVRQSSAFLPVMQTSPNSTKMSTNLRLQSKISTNTGVFGDKLMGREESLADGTETYDDQRLIFQVHPHSLKRISWDLASLLAVMYDMVVIPMTLFEFFDDPKDYILIEVMSWTTRLFWTLDMGMSMCTGLMMPNGHIMFETKFILWNYAKTWLLLDSFIVLSDWIEFIMAQGDGGGGLAGIGRVFRIVRCVRLLRLVRMKSVMKSVVERFHSDRLTFALKMVQLVLVMFGLAHIVACCWWGVGKSAGRDTWSSSYQGTDVSVSSRYLISLHWALSQFSGGMEEVRPKTAVERLFAVVIWTYSFFFATIVVSILTSCLVQAHIIGGSQARQLSTLRKYLKQNSISKTLSLRVQSSAQYAISGDLRPDVVDLLGVVSDQLRLEMNFEMYSELIRCHPFFNQCIVFCPQAARRICHQAISTLLLDADDVVFSKGEAPAEPKMYFIFKGTFEYTALSGVKTVLGEKQWIAEPVLWVEWVHRGQLKAVSTSKVAKLDSKKFVDIMERFKEVLPAGISPKVYANEFCQYLNDQPAMDQVTDMTGLFALPGQQKNSKAVSQSPLPES